MHAPATSKPFAKKTFYLDLKGYQHEVKLAKDLKLLGGKQETFLSKDVSFVVSNKISVKPSLWTSTQKSHSVPSPLLFNESTLDYLDSPAHAASPIPESNPCPMSRGLSLLQKAKQKKQGTTDIIEVCKQWNIKVYSVQKVSFFIEKYKNLYFKKYAAEQKQELKQMKKSNEVVHKIRAPFIKIEHMNRKYKPRYKEFSSWTDIIDSTLSRNVNQLHRHFKVSGNVSDNLLIPLRETNLKPLKTLSQQETLKTPSVSLSKISVNPHASNSLLAHCANEGGKENFDINLKRKAKDSKRKVKKRFCEICNVYYTDLDVHIKTNLHDKHMSDPKKFLAVGKIMESFPEVDKFLEPFRNTCVENKYVKRCSEDVTHFETQVADLKMENKVENNLNGGPAVEHENEDVCTELYSFANNDYVSASCSSPESSSFPYLEDSMDKLIRNSCSDKSHSFKEKFILFFDAVQNICDKKDNVKLMETDTTFKSSKVTLKCTEATTIINETQKLQNVKEEINIGDKHLMCNGDKIALLSSSVVDKNSLFTNGDIKLDGNVKKDNFLMDGLVNNLNVSDCVDPKTNLISKLMPNIINCNISSKQTFESLQPSLSLNNNILTFGEPYSSPLDLTIPGKTIHLNDVGHTSDLTAIDDMLCESIKNAVWVNNFLCATKLSSKHVIDGNSEYAVKETCNKLPDVSCINNVRIDECTSLIPSDGKLIQTLMECKNSNSYFLKGAMSPETKPMEDELKHESNSELLINVKECSEQNILCDANKESLIENLHSYSNVCINASKDSCLSYENKASVNKSSEDCPYRTKKLKLPLSKSTKSTLGSDSANESLQITDVSKAYDKDTSDLHQNLGPVVKALSCRRKLFTLDSNVDSNAVQNENRQINNCNEYSNSETRISCKCSQIHRQYPYKSMDNITNFSYFKNENISDVTNVPMQKCYKYSTVAHSDFDFSSDSETESTWENFHSEVDSLYKSLDTGDENALDLSINCEKYNAITLELKP